MLISFYSKGLNHDILLIMMSMENLPTTYEVEYNARFRILAVKTGITNQSMLISFYSKGLNHDILLIMMSMENLPTTYEAYLTCAKQIDTQQH
jgi:hypothetical protein